MGKYTIEDIGGKRVRIPSVQEFTTFFKKYSPPDPKNPWLRNLLCAIYEGGPTGVTFNEAHRNIVRSGIKWGREATAMKLNQLARMVIRKMSISIGTKVKKPFYSPFLVEFDNNWKTNGHLHLKPEVARSLEAVGWVSNGARQVSRRKPIINDIPDPADPDSFLADEGNSREVSVRRIERSRAARNACIKKFKAICAVCGLCFGKKYGEKFEDLIQVHHLHPLGFRKERKTDYEKDLRPICPNCHAMAHWNKHKKAPRSIDELKRIVKGHA
jgi:predicted HNH restriction endonuclease